MPKERAILVGAVALLMVAIAALIIVRDRQRAAEWRQNDLGEVLTFADAARCRTGEPLTQIVRGLWDRESPTAKAGGPISVPGFAEPLRPRLRRRYVAIPATRGVVTYAELSLRGRWHGLKVLGLRESPDTGLEIWFAEPADRVRETLVRAGFPLADVGEWRDAAVGPSALPPRMSIQSGNGATIFHCLEGGES